MASMHTLPMSEHFAHTFGQGNTFTVKMKIMLYVGELSLFLLFIYQIIYDPVY